ncbi:MAG: glycosyltransferase, partial [Vicinamibacterales bacterium]
HQYSPFVYGRLATVFRRNVRVVYTEHGRLSDAPPSMKRRMVNPWLQASGQHICAVSEDLKNYMVASGFTREAIRVVYNGIDVRGLCDPNGRSRVAALGVPVDALIVGTIARLDPVKNLETLIEALAHTHRTTLLQPHAVIVGAGPQLAALERLAGARGLGAFVHFAGHREDAREWLPEFDLFVNSSISEGVSLTILEAMAAALPIVATAVGGTPEVIVNGSTGVLVPARDPAQLARAAAQILSDPDRRREMGRAARSRVETLFTLDRMVRDYAGIYAG